MCYDAPAHPLVPVAGPDDTRWRAHPAATGHPDTDFVATGLVTLPHTALRLPDQDLRVTALRQQPTRNGVAFTAKIAVRGTIAGTIDNGGNGGATFYRASHSSPFNDARAMTRYARACRVNSRTPSEEFILDALVEYDNATHVAQATRAERSPLRLVAPILGIDDGNDDGDGTYITVDLTTAPTGTTPEQRDTLVADLLRQAPRYHGQRWQRWTGQRWEDLTPPAADQPAAGV